MSVDYVIILVDEDDAGLVGMEEPNFKSEFVVVGTIIHGRTFKCTRPTHILDCTSGEIDPRYLQHLKIIAPNAKWL